MPLKKKYLSNEAIRKIKQKQMMWKTYRHTGSEEAMPFIKKHLTKLQLKLEIQREATKTN